jgi:hypothetical protein
MMLSLQEEAEQRRINRAQAFGRSLAALSDDETLTLRGPDDASVAQHRRELGAIALDAGRQERCARATQWARTELAGGCDCAMQQIAQAAGDGRLPEWGSQTDPWLALQPSIELHAMSLVLDDLLTDEQRRTTRIAGL